MRRHVHDGCAVTIRKSDAARSPHKARNRKCSWRRHRHSTRQVNVGSVFTSPHETDLDAACWRLVTAMRTDAPARARTPDPPHLEERGKGNRCAGPDPPRPHSKSSYRRLTSRRLGAWPNLGCPPFSSGDLTALHHGATSVTTLPGSS